MHSMKMLILGTMMVLGMSTAQAKNAAELSLPQETNYSYGLHPVCQAGQEREYIYNAQGQIVGWRCVW